MNVEWQPIETAPKTGRAILFESPSVFTGTLVENETNGGETWMADDGVYVEPTHWMPLPEPPK